MTGPLEPTCIYCKRDFEGGEVKRSREHLFPKAFACPDWLVLTCVCEECNQSFKRMEQWLARDTLEGIRRYKAQVMTPDKGTRLQRLQMQVPYEPQFGLLQGAFVYPAPERPGKVTFPAQLGLSFTSERREYFTWSMLVGDTPEHLINRERARSMRENVFMFGDWHCGSPKYRRLWQHVIRGPGCPSEPEQAVSKLSLLGIMHIKKKKGGGQGLPEPLVHRGDIDVRMRGYIDLEVKRAIAKICFNYAAYALSSAALLGAEFDEARRFIRHGKGSILGRATGEQYLVDGQPVRNPTFRLVRNEQGIFMGISLNGLQEYVVRLSPFSKLILPERFQIFDLETGAFLNPKVMYTAGHYSDEMNISNARPPPA